MGDYTFKPNLSSPLKTYIIQFIYKNGNGWAFVNAFTITQAQNIFKTQTQYKDAKVTSIKETKYYGDNIQLVYEGAVTTIINAQANSTVVIDKTVIEETIRENLGNYFTKAEVQDLISEINIEVDLSDYYNKTEVDTKIANIPAGQDGITPHINQSNNHWMIGNTDTGVLAIGRDGTPGATPRIDKFNKHWIIGTTDTGIVAEGKDGDDGITPSINPTTKHWMIGNTDTGILAEGTGTPGDDGKSAYEIYRDHTENPMTEEQWVEAMTGGDVTVNTNVKYVEYQPGYSEDFCDPAKQTFTFEDNPVPNRFSKLKGFVEKFEEDNAEALENAANTRVFLQGLIDNANEGDIIMFPKDKTFVIDFNKLGFAYDAVDIPASNTEQMENLSMDYDTAFKAERSDSLSDNEGFANKEDLIHFLGLAIRKKVHINLNGSTIKMVPNILTHVIVIKIGIGYFHNTNYNDAAYTPDGTIIENGTVDGGSDWSLTSSLFSTSKEHYKCIDTQCTVELKNLEVKNSFGDGICCSSKISWGDGVVTFYTVSNGSRQMNYGYIDNDGSIKTMTQSESSGRVYSNRYELEGENGVLGKFGRNNILVRPRYLVDGVESMVDMGPYYVSEYFTVAYYDANDNPISNKTEILQFGDMLSIPDSAVYVRFAVRKSPEYDNNPSYVLNLMCCRIIWSYGVKLTNCNTYNCGRDGFTLSSLPGGEIVNCSAKNSGQVSIDIESTAYMDKDFLIKAFTTKGGVKGTTAHNITFEDCKIGILELKAPGTTIIGCDIEELTLSSSRDYDFNYNISKPRREVNRSILRNKISAAFTIFNNCVLGGDKVNIFFDKNTGSFYPSEKNIDNNVNNRMAAGNSYISNNGGDYKNVFNNCVIKTDCIGPYIYNNCIITSKKGTGLSTFNLDGTYEQDTFIFKGCKIITPEIAGIDTPSKHSDYGAIVDMEGCELMLGPSLNGTLAANYPGEGGKKEPNFRGCFFKRLVGNTIKYVPTSGKYLMAMQPFRSCDIKNNLFIPSTAVQNIKIANVILNNVTGVEAYNMNIEGNIVRYLYSGNSSVHSFISINAKQSTDNTRISLRNNVLKSDSLASVRDIIFNTSANDAPDISVECTNTITDKVNLTTSQDTRVKYGFTETELRSTIAELSSRLDALQASIPASN